MRRSIPLILSTSLVWLAASAPGATRADTHAQTAPLALRGASQAGSTHGPVTMPAVAAATIPAVAAASAPATAPAAGAATGPAAVPAAEAAAASPAALPAGSATRPPEPIDAVDIDVRGLQRHARTIAKLIGHPARELAAKLGQAAMVGDGAIEWSLAGVGVEAASAYGYASVVHGAVTGFLIRGRAPLDELRRLHLPRPLQLTLAGGERPSYSIAAGE